MSGVCLLRRRSSQPMGASGLTERIKACEEAFLVLQASQVQKQRAVPQPADDRYGQAAQGAGERIQRVPVTVGTSRRAWLSSVSVGSAPEPIWLRQGWVVTVMPAPIRAATAGAIRAASASISGAFRASSRKVGRRAARRSESR